MAQAIKKFFWTVLFIDLLKGLILTEKYQWKENFCVQYPTQKMTMPPRFRGRLVVDMDMCISCMLCEIACPTDVITIIKNADKTKKIPAEFKIDFGRCSFCGLCVDPCPTDAIKHHEEYELASYCYDDLYHDMEKVGRLWPEGIKDYK